MKPAALYERQRALMRAGLLKAEAGRGPGSGVRATPQAMAMLFIAIAATASLSEVEEQAKIIARLKSTAGRCPLTGQKTFASALAAVLASKDLLGKVQWIEIERGGAKVGASMCFKEADADNVQESHFGARKARYGGDLSVQVTFSPQITVLRMLVNKEAKQ